MSKSDSNKTNPETDSPKKVEKKGFFSRVARDVKNLGVGIAPFLLILLPILWIWALRRH